MDGHDVTLDVGSSVAIEGKTLTAIFQVGRVGYTVHCEETDRPDRRSAFSMPRTTVYDVSDFDR